jgi:hypothetical protein
MAITKKVIHFAKLRDVNFVKTFDLPSKNQIKIINSKILTKALFISILSYNQLSFLPNTLTLNFTVFIIKNSKSIEFSIYKISLIFAAICITKYAITMSFIV